MNWNIYTSLKFDSSNSADFEQVKKTYLSILESQEIGFFRLPDSDFFVRECEETFNKFQHKTHFVHIGIGGSSLGPEMLINALGAKNSKTKFTFINNIDPDDFSHKIPTENFENCLFYVVSKSGTTAETIAALSIVMGMLKQKGIKEESFKDYFVFCTDPDKGDLRSLSKTLNISCLTIPANVGGRYSVLTSVGLFPSLFAGISIRKLLSGAKEFKDSLTDFKKGKNFYDLAFWIGQLEEQKVNETVIMPYSSLLKDFSAWFVQLWAESLGKNGRGLTPIPAYGATDQHSQMQLFMEGPENKVLMLLEVEKFQTDFKLTSTIGLKSFESLSPFTLSELMKAELEGTLAALKEKNKNLVHFKLPVLDAFTLGQLILFSECLTVLVGKKLKIDPFNQPGVEAGKIYAYSWLKNKSI